jgi:hypothetical protein
MSASTTRPRVEAALQAVEERHPAADGAGPPAS